MTQNNSLWIVNIPNGPGHRNSALLARNQGKTLEEWHRSLGHMGVTSILKLADSGVVDDMVIKGERTFINTDQCDTCIISKSTRLTFGDHPSAPANR